MLAYSFTMLNGEMSSGSPDPGPSNGQDGTFVPHLHPDVGIASGARDATGAAGAATGDAGALRASGIPVTRPRVTSPAGTRPTGSTFGVSGQGSDQFMSNAFPPSGGGSLATRGAGSAGHGMTMRAGATANSYFGAAGVYGAASYSTSTPVPNGCLGFKRSVEAVQVTTLVVYQSNLLFI